MKHAPATPLPFFSHPWSMSEIRPGYSSLRAGNMNQLGVGEIFDTKDAAYIAHAANAYPRLVEALRFYADAANWQEQETGIGMVPCIANSGTAETLLRELGEIE